MKRLVPGHASAGGRLRQLGNVCNTSFVLSAENLEVSRRNNRSVTTGRGGPGVCGYTRLKISHFLVSISTPKAGGVVLARFLLRSVSCPSPPAFGMTKNGPILM